MYARTAIKALLVVAIAAAITLFPAAPASAAVPETYKNWGYTAPSAAPHTVWTWNTLGNQWIASTIPGSTSVYIWPFATGWHWVWTQQSGWRAMNSSLLVSTLPATTPTPTPTTGYARLRFTSIRECQTGTSWAAGCIPLNWNGALTVFLQGSVTRSTTFTTTQCVATAYAYQNCTVRFDGLAPGTYRINIIAMGRSTTLTPAAVAVVAGGSEQNVDVRVN